jgi:putative glutamine amidotransferase
LTEGSIVAEAMGSTHVAVNTHHHQGLDDVAEPLDEIGYSEDGVLEVVVSREHTFVVGVQWHPEAMVPMHAPQKGLFHAFADAVAPQTATVSGSLTARSA